jgi:hypothetical protein
MSTAQSKLGFYIGNDVFDGNTRIKIGVFSLEDGIIGSGTMRVERPPGVTWQKTLLEKAL